MKKLILLIMMMSVFVNIAFAQEIKTFVNDYANVISPDEEYQIKQVLEDVYDSKVAEFAVVTISSLKGRDIESYSLELAQGNLGDPDKNNGLLLLVAVQDRKYRFEVGRGLEPYLNDAKVGRIGRTYLVENFRDEDYGKGIFESVMAVKAILMNDEESTYYVAEEPQPEFNPAIIFLIIIIIMIIFSAFAAKKTKGTDDEYFNAAIMAGVLFGGRGGRGGFGGSGGFGGFGGGGFGGGGAGGGW